MNFLKIVCSVFVMLGSIAYGSEVQEKSSPQEGKSLVRNWVTVGNVEQVKPFAGQIVLYRAMDHYLTAGERGYSIVKGDSTLRVGWVSRTSGASIYHKDYSQQYESCPISRLLVPEKKEFPCSCNLITPHIQGDNEGKVIEMGLPTPETLQLILKALQQGCSFEWSNSSYDAQMIKKLLVQQ